MYRLRISFTCLCAYLPRKDEVLVVIPDGRMGGNGAHMGNGAHAGNGESSAGSTMAVTPHVPVIEFDPADLSPETEVQPDLCFRRPAPGAGKWSSPFRDWGLVFLTGNDVKLEPASLGVPTIRAGRQSGSEVPTSDADAEDFSWIADVAKLDAAAGIMDPACVVPGSSADGRVAARVSLRGGTLAAQLLAQAKDGGPIVFDFSDANEKEPPRQDCSQALAAGAAYDLLVNSDKVALVITSFAKDERRLVFSFAGRPVGSAIEILIKNMPLDSLLELTSAINPDAPVDVDSHFQMYYALSATPPATPWIPHPGRARTGEPICPAARFSLLE